MSEVLTAELGTRVSSFDQRRIPRTFPAALAPAGRSYLMLLSISYLISHTTAYVSENLTCLFYGLEILATRSAFFASYYDLVSDLAEAFGV